MKLMKKTKKIVALMLAFAMVVTSLVLSKAPKKVEAAVNLGYRAHVADIGWQNFCGNGEIAGTTGQSKRLEALQISAADVTYRAHVADIGWQNWVGSGQIAGTTGQSKAIEAVQIRINGKSATEYDIYYRMHVAEKGWLGWAKNGQKAGTEGLGLRAEAIQIIMVKHSENISNYGISYRGNDSFVGAITYGGSASYNTGAYCAKLKNLTLNGNARNDIVNIARTQVGYHAGNSSTQLNGHYSDGSRYTEYGSWYGMQDMWCAMFVSWCAHVAGVDTSVIPKSSYTPTMLNFFKNKGRAYSRQTIVNGGYTPKEGDIIFFKGDRNNNETNHVGIVTGFNGSVIYTIEGNTSAGSYSTNGGSVMQKERNLSSSFIVYVCSPNYQ